MIEQTLRSIIDVSFSKRWKHWTVSIGVLFLSFVFGYLSSPLFLYLILLVAGAVLAFGYLTRKLEWGIFAIPILAFYTSFEIGTGTRVSLNLAFISSGFMIALWLAKMVIIDRNLSVPNQRVYFVALGFMIITGLALVSGNIIWLPKGTELASTSAQLGAAGLYVLPLGLMMLTGKEVNSRKWLQWFTWTFIFIGGSYFLRKLIGEVFDFYPGPLGNIHSGATGAMLHVWFPAMTFSQALFNKDLRLWQRLGLVVATMISLVSAYLLDKLWLSGWVSFAIVLFVVVWLRSVRLGLFVSSVLLVSFLVFPQIITQTQTGSQIYSQSSRLAAWEIVLDIARANPLLGVGPANYYHLTPLFAIMGFFVKFNSHNNYIDIVAQIGVFGLLFYLWLMVEIGITGLQLRPKVKSGFEQAYTNGALAGLAGMAAAGMMGDWVLPFLYNIGINGYRAVTFSWIFLGGLLALYRMVQQEENRAPIAPAAEDTLVDG